MKIVSLHAAKSNFARLMKDVAKGEEIVITKAAKPIARIVPVEKARPGKRVLGLLAGRMTISSDFDAPLPADLLDAFEGADKTR